MGDEAATGPDAPQANPPTVDAPAGRAAASSGPGAWQTLGLALLAGAILLVMFFPRVALWRSLTLGVYWNTAEVWRALITLEQIQDPFAPIREPMHQIVRYRLLIPVIWHYTGLPTLLALALPHVGVVLTLWLIVHEVVRRSGDRLLGGCAAVLFGGTSWFFVSTGWLSYNDSLLTLAMLACLLRPSRGLLAVCCVLTPWIDERFILALPLVLVCRQGALDRQESPWRALGRDVAAAAAASAPYLLFRLAMLFAGDAVSASYVSNMGQDIRLATPGRLLLGWWMSLRAGWVLVVAAVVLTWFGGRRLHALMMTLFIAGLSVASLFMAADQTRNFCLMIPAAVLGLLLWQARQPVTARRVAATLAVLQLVLPAAHVFWAATTPIQTLPAEWRRRPLELTADYYIDRGQRLRQLGDDAAAMAEFDLAIRVEPRSAPAWASRGLLANKLQQRPQARADLDRAVELDPRWPEGWAARAILHEAHGQWDAAIADLGEALRVAPADWPARAQVERRIEALRQRAASTPSP
jgi:tetratricopeptide (TPR) repeat protein